MSYYYSAREHNEALRRHDELWGRMHELGIREGRDSPAYAEARDAAVAARRRVSEIARKPTGPVRRGTGTR